MGGTGYVLGELNQKQSQNQSYAVHRLEDRGAGTKGAGTKEPGAHACHT